MSAYQYYEFRAIDRRLDRAAQEALRGISSRAAITEASFINHYNWGDFRGDPVEMVERWFDLHLYFASWGARRLIFRLPIALVDSAELERILGQSEWATITPAGETLIVDITTPEAEGDDDWYYEEEDSSVMLTALAPLRDDLIAGDCRSLYLLWLAGVHEQAVPDDELEPLPGIGALTVPLGAFAEFFGIDPDLVAAAAETGEASAAASEAQLREMLAAIPEPEKTGLLLRVVEGDPHVGAELRRRARGPQSTSGTYRTAGELRRRAARIADAREQAAAERRAVEVRRQAERDAEEQRARLVSLKRRGDDAWREVEEEIERRNEPGYDRAASLLFDLHRLAAEQGSESQFERRLSSIKVRHEKKSRFLERLALLDDGA